MQGFTDDLVKWRKVPCPNGFRSAHRASLQTGSHPACGEMVLALLLAYREGGEPWAERDMAVAHSWLSDSTANDIRTGTCKGFRRRVGFRWITLRRRGGPNNLAHRQDPSLGPTDWVYRTARRQHLAWKSLGSKLRMKEDARQKTATDRPYRCVRKNTFPERSVHPLEPHDRAKVPVCLSLPPGN